MAAMVKLAAARIGSDTMMTRFDANSLAAAHGKCLGKKTNKGAKKALAESVFETPGSLIKTACDGCNALGCSDEADQVSKTCW